MHLLVRSSSYVCPDSHLTAANLSTNTSYPLLRTFNWLRVFEVINCDSLAKFKPFGLFPRAGRPQTLCRAVKNMCSPCVSPISGRMEIFNRSPNALERRTFDKHLTLCDILCETMILCFLFRISFYSFFVFCLSAFVFVC